MVGNEGGGRDCGWITPDRPRLSHSISTEQQSKRIERRRRIVSLWILELKILLLWRRIPPRSRCAACPSSSLRYTYDYCKQTYKEKQQI